MRAVTMKEAKARLNQLVEAATRGEQVVLMRGSKHVAAIVPISVDELELAARLTDAQAERLWKRLAEERVSGRTLVFDSPMTVTTTDGMIAKLNSASLDMNAGSMSTGDPVEILFKGSKITALSMNMADNGRVIVFENRVRVDIEPSKTPDKAASGGSNAVN